MGMNDNVKGLIRCVADNDLQKAKQYVKALIANETAQSNKGFCNSIKTKLEAPSANMMELPGDLKSLLKMEDVSISFNENRYYLPAAEKELFEKIHSARVVNNQLAEMGIRYLNSTLLYGESGTGKTTFGRYVAYKLGLPFVYLNFSHCVSSYLGSTGKNIEKVFEYASKVKCVFMLDEVDEVDEVDAVGLERGHSAEVGEMSRVVISIMQALDLLDNDCVVIGATNRLDILDKALVRRFAIKHEVKTLTQTETLLLLQKFMGDLDIEYNHSDFVEYSKAHNKQSEIVNDIIQSLVLSLKENIMFELKTA